ncbi:MAG TPA: DUF4268 domain-containing protein [Pyrinomonadaceae bacterium]|nr:DUF4268 domain-containing protein [Pyrinomonadaceae bacterium]
MSPTQQIAQTPHRKFLERLLILNEGRTTLVAKLPPSARDFIEISAGISGLHFRYVVGQNKTRVELYIARRDEAANKRIFDKLKSHKHEIEAAFDGELSWERLEGSKSSRIACRQSNGGSKGDEARWEMVQHPMIDAMTRLEQALRPFISRLPT